MSKIIIPYKPRFPQTVIHPELDKKRFSIIVMHRRAGKTVMLINHTIKQAAKNSLWQPRYAYIAPFLKQAKITTWSYWKHFTAPIPGIRANESELYIELPNLARIYLFGADNPDAIRGPYWDGVILDEYAQIKPEVYNEIIRPALADRKGWAVFSGTPKGQNQFLDIFETAQRQVAGGDALWYWCLFRADETGALDEEELRIMRETMPDSTYRQEMLCDFTASADNILIPIDLVTDAAARKLHPEAVSGAPKILGVDPARFGDDRSVVIRRQGLQAFTPIIRRGIDLMSLVGLVATEIRDWQPDAVFVDGGGLGAGVVDRLRQLGYDVMDVNFGGKATKPAQYENKRAEIWDSMREWLEQGGAIPNIPELKTDLVTPTYGYDKANRMKLESKDEIKKRGGHSPDIADALALTWAFPVAMHAAYGMHNRRNTVANNDFDVFGG